MGACMLNHGVIAGSFDVIHPGYVYMFEECKKYCNKLTILLQDDPTVERPFKLKPILTFEEREKILYSIRYIDNVIRYTTEEELLIHLTRENFDIRFLGDDYLDKEFTGKYMHRIVHFIPRHHGWSTTKFKKLIAESICK